MDANTPATSLAAEIVNAHDLAADDLFTARGTLLSLVLEIVNPWLAAEGTPDAEGYIAASRLYLTNAGRGIAGAVWVLGAVEPGSAIHTALVNAVEAMSYALEHLESDGAVNAKTVRGAVGRVVDALHKAEAVLAAQGNG